MGCDSGNLGSLSRVQLLLLDRTAPETLLSPSGLEQTFSPVQDWLTIQCEDPGWSSADDLRPCTAGSISESWDSAGRVQRYKSVGSEGGSGSPSSWIIDPSPTFSMFRSSDSTRQSSNGSHTDIRSPGDKKPEYPGKTDQVLPSDGDRRPESPEYKSEERERRMEERKTKVLNMLSKLQDSVPRRSRGSNSHSDFEDCQFITMSDTFLFQPWPV
ncbi:uncharacterized protein LOC133424583 [Cololabis saira]|uniref:uncharacterized protein LOC133424583 n=1 Tax=Cololabis saira TaxID=129043 RepID=UPI002AD4881B|nr:uncharacterized protein LOC133424583 [Cololabis saira]